MRFILAALMFMYVGRKLGWALSKTYLYSAPIVLSLIGAAAWGVAVGVAMSGLIGWLHPNAILRWIFGFALAAYVAVPNFGLFMESTIPESEQPRHLMISNIPLVTYVITELATRSMRA